MMSVHVQYGIPVTDPQRVNLIWFTVVLSKYPDTHMFGLQGDQKIYAERAAGCWSVGGAREILHI